jgi:hypothetical protein
LSNANGMSMQCIARSRPPLTGEYHWKRYKRQTSTSEVLSQRSNL